ncbi:hypothetical protein SETIT_3G406100v2 [Setaria italica]|uniref:Uncharacterized protein n=1 Tax=Setaria italica TaxID=4555 RepID=A0A368QNZ5_SETIT|nr:hypothetical protein SETIT_3G406100v2 [Setaria italica]
MKHIQDGVCCVANLPSTHSNAQPNHSIGVFCGFLPSVATILSLNLIWHGRDGTPPSSSSSSRRSGVARPAAGDLPCNCQRCPHQHEALRSAAVVDPPRMASAPPHRHLLAALHADHPSGASPSSPKCAPPPSASAPSRIPPPPPRSPPKTPPRRSRHTRRHPSTSPRRAEEPRTCCSTRCSSRFAARDCSGGHCRPRASTRTTLHRRVVLDAWLRYKRREDELDLGRYCSRPAPRRCPPPNMLQGDGVSSGHWAGSGSLQRGAPTAAGVGEAWGRAAVGAGGSRGRG